MKRFGPLHSTVAGVVLGDPGRKHVLLTPAEFGYGDGGDVQQTFAWEEIEAVNVDMPTTRFRFPGVLAGIASAILVALIQENPNLGPDAGRVTIRTADTEAALPLDRHHFGGYWAPTMRATQRMLDQLVGEPASRNLLNHPDDLLGAVAAAARRKR